MNVSRSKKDEHIMRMMARVMAAPIDGTPP